MRVGFTPDYIVRSLMNVQTNSEFVVSDTVVAGFWFSRLSYSVGLK